MSKAPYFDGSQLCAQVDGEAWFSDQSDRAHLIAKSICADCHFRVPCLEFALENKQRGIWGGLNEKERQSLRRRRARLDVAS